MEWSLRSTQLVSSTLFLTLKYISLSMVCAKSKLETELMKLSFNPSIMWTAWKHSSISTWGKLFLFTNCGCRCPKVQQMNLWCMQLPYHQLRDGRKFGLGSVISSIGSTHSPIHMTPESSTPSTRSNVWGNVFLIERKLRWNWSLLMEKFITQVLSLMRHSMTACPVRTWR